MYSSPLRRGLSRRETLGLFGLVAAGAAFGPAALRSSRAVAATSPTAAAGATVAPVPLPLAPLRVPQLDMGVWQQPDGNMQWWADARLGMFIHWGVYAGPAQGEWYMENKGIAPTTYRKYYTDASSEQFTASAWDPTALATLASDLGAKYTVLTARHHEGFALWPSTYPDSWNAGQSPQKKDFVSGYVSAVRQAGLKVGLYFSPINWQYPGYYDVTGTSCAPNTFGYTTDPAHKENARLLKNEVYQTVRELVSNYGALDVFWWDGAWLGQQGSDRDGAFFWEPGRYRDASNQWPVDAAYSESDGTGTALGLTGLVRTHQPNAISNARSGWMGDFGNEEGSGVPTGPLRTDLTEKCFTIGGAWGYKAGAGVMSYGSIVSVLVNAWVRNMTCLLNVGPDRTGVVPDAQQSVVRQVGGFVKANAEAIYGTRGGPWDPVDGQYGFTMKGSTIYVHLLPGFSGSSVTIPSVGDASVTRAFDLISGSALAYTVSGADRRVTVSGIDRSRYPDDTVIGITLDRSVVPGDIAVGASASADSEQSSNPASAAIDGNTATRWCANDGATGHRLQVDLGSAKTVTGTRIAWEQTADYRYIVEGSTDGAAWTLLVDRRQTPSTTQVHAASLSARVRYLRVTVTGLPSGVWASVRSVEVYDRPFTASAGTVRLVHRRSGKVLDVANASGDDGAGLILYHSTGGSNQQWSLLTAAGGGYRIANVRSGKMLESPGGSSNGAALDQWTDNGGDNQSWRFVPGTSDGFVRIVNVRTGLAMDAKNGATDDGTPIIQWTASANDNQDWQVVSL